MSDDTPMPKPAFALGQRVVANVMAQIDNSTGDKFMVAVHAEVKGIRIRMWESGKYYSYELDVVGECSTLSCVSEADITDATLLNIDDAITRPPEKHNDIDGADAKYMAQPDTKETGGLDSGGAPSMFN